MKKISCSLGNGVLFKKLLIFTLFFIANSLIAGPEGGNIVGGGGAIRSNENTTTINQSTDLMAIDWQSYNVNSDERVQYIQPDASSISLNRILSNHGSQIHGRIDANGQVILVNPNGIVFGENATINVGGILASGLNINPDDFMNGDFTFSALEEGEGKVINSGLINASIGGSVTLLGKQVENEGLIVANLGAVNLAAGNEAVITFDNSGLMGVRITREILQDELGVDAAVINSGEISAENGRVLLSGSVSQDIFTQALNIEGQATSVVVHEDGSFTLGSGADVVNTGNIDVSSRLPGTEAGQVIVLGENLTSSGNIRAEGEGGNIELHSVNTTLLTENSLTSVDAFDSGVAGNIKVLGRNVGLVDSAIVSASGVDGGGEILIGGDETGENRLIPNSQFVFLGSGTNVFADSLREGSGGRLIVFAEDTTRVHGGLFARGGEISGAGGFIETSGLKGFSISSVPNASANNNYGKDGEWLIDPYNILITTAEGSNEFETSDGPNFVSNSGDSRLDPSLIIQALSTSNVTIQTGTGGTQAGNITVASAIALPSSFNRSGTLRLIAHNDIIVNSYITAENSNRSLNILLDAGRNIQLGSGFDLISNGRTISLTGVGFNVARGHDNDHWTTINSNGGAISLNFSGDIAIDASNNSGGSAGDLARILTEGGNLTMSAANFSFGSINSGSYIDTAGGDLSVDITGNFLLGRNGANSNNVSINTGGGRFDLYASGSVNVFQQIVTNGGDLTIGDVSSNVLPSSVTLRRFASNGTVSSANSVDTSSTTGGGSISIYSLGNVAIGSLNVTDTDNTISDIRGPEIYVDSGGSISLTQAFNFNSTGVRVGSVADYTFEPSITFIADNDITLSGEISDSLLGTRDALNISLTADADSSGSGTISILADMYSGGGNFSASGHSIVMAPGIVVNADYAGSGANSDRSNGGDIALYSSTDLLLGDLVTDRTCSDAGGSCSSLSGRLDIGSRNPSLTSINVSQADGSSLNIFGNATFDVGILGDVILTETGNIFSDSVVIPSASNVDIYAGGGLTFGDAVIRENLHAEVANMAGISQLPDTQMIVGSMGNGGNVIGGATFTLGYGGVLTLSEANDFSQISLTAFGATVRDENNLVLGNIRTGYGTDLGITVDAGTLSQAEDAGISSGLNVSLSSPVIEITNIETASDQSSAGSVTLTGNTIRLMESGLIDTSSSSMFSSRAGTITVNVANEFAMNGTIRARANPDADSTTDGALTVIGSGTGNTFRIENGAIWDSDGDFTINGEGGSDVFNINAAIENLLLNGGSGGDTFNIAVTGNYGVTIAGGGGTDTIVGPNVASTWTIDDEESGYVETGSSQGSGQRYIGAFSNVENLSGGSANDLFIMEDDADIGRIDGNATNSGSDQNRLISSGSSARTWSLTGVTSGSLTHGSVQFEDIQSIAGSGSTADTLIGLNQNSVWTVDGAQTGSYALTANPNVTILFEGMDVLQGGSQVDQFSFDDGFAGTFEGAWRGGAGNDVFNLTGEVEDDIFGEVGADRFVIQSGDAQGEIWGGADTGETNIDTVVAVQGSANFWRLTGSNQGTVNTGNSASATSVSFGQMDRLEGSSSQNDIFEFTTAVPTAMFVVGGNASGTDSVRYGFTNQAANLSVVANGSNIAGVQEIENIEGNGFRAGNTFSTLAAVNTGITNWNITGENAGSLTLNDQAVTFSDFPGLSGGEGSDNFTVGNSGEIYSINGGGGTDNSLTGRSANSSFIIGRNANQGARYLQLTGSSTYVSSFVNIQRLVGASASDIFDASQLQQNINIDLGNPNDFSTYAVQGIETIAANISRNNSIRGATVDGGNQWNLNSRFGGSVSGLQFSGFHSLYAGDGGDTFTIVKAAEHTSPPVDASVPPSTISRARIYGGGGQDTILITGNLSDLPNFASANWLLGETSSLTMSYLYDYAEFVETDPGFPPILPPTFELIPGENQIDEAIAFSGIENLTGNERPDIFSLAGGATSQHLAGITVDGNGATVDPSGVQDTLNLQSLSEAIELSLDEFFNTSLTIENIESIAVNSGYENTLRGYSAGSSWLIDGPNEVTISSAGNRTWDLTGFAHLVGGSVGNDTFTFQGSGRVISIDGNGGSANILRGRDANNTWTISEQTDSGTVISQGSIAIDGTEYLSRFNNIQSLQGGTGSDTFIADSNLAATINGGDGADALVSGHGSSVVWRVTGAGAGTANWLSGFFGIETIRGSANSDQFYLDGGSIGTIEGGAGQEDTLIAVNNNQANQWIVNGNNSSVNNVTRFAGIENLTGNSEADEFRIINNQTSGSGTLDGQLSDFDLLDLTGYGTAVEFDIGAGGVLGFDTVSVERFELNPGLINRLYGGNTGRIWEITGSNAVTVDGTSYVNFGELIGGTGGDQFIFSPAGRLTGSIRGGSGANDILEGADQATDWNISGTGTGSLAVAGTTVASFDGIEDLIGGTGTDTFGINGDIESIAGGAGSDIFNINAVYTGLLDGQSDNDEFNINFGGTFSIAGGDGVDALYANYASDLAWTINDIEGGFVEDTLSPQNIIAFTNIQIIHGSNNSDSFDVTADFAGTLNGRDGNDRFDLTGSVGAANGDAGQDIFNILADTVEGALDGGMGDDTLALGHAEDVIWNIDGVNNTIVSQGGGRVVGFARMELGQGSAGNDIFNISVTFNRLEGNQGFDEFNIDAPGVTAVLQGSSGPNSFSVLNVNHASENTWTLDGANLRVSAGGGVVTFSSMGVLNGGAATDIFNIVDAFSSSSSVNGRGGNDIFNLSAEVLVGLSGDDGSDTFVINDARYSYILIGGEGTGTDTVSIQYAENSRWILNGLNNETVQSDIAAEATEFTSIEIIQGGQGVDSVELHASFNGTIDGRGNADIYTIHNPGVEAEISDSDLSGIDSLSVLHDEDTAWTIDAGDSRLVDGSGGDVVFSGIERASGGGGADIFNIGASIVNNIFGGTGDDQFTLTATGLVLDIWGEAGDDSLTGANADNSWQITGVNTGSLTGGGTVNFTDTEYLTGGTGDDSFVFTSDQSQLNGGIDGGLHAINGDSIDATQLGGGLRLSMLPDDSADFSFVNVENITVSEQVIGSWNLYNTLLGDNADNIWIFTGRNTGRVQDIDGNPVLNFTGFQHVFAGTGSDTIRLNNENAGVDGSIYGGQGGPDFIDYSEIQQDYQAILGDTPGGVYGIEGAIGFMPGTAGEGYQRTLLVENTGVGSWLISDYDGTGGIADGENDGEYTFTPQGQAQTTTLSFANFDRIVGGQGDDEFVFSGNATITGLIDGGSGYNVVNADREVLDGEGLDRIFQLNGTVPDIVSLQNIQQVIGNVGDSNTLIAGDLGTSHSWVIDGENRGEVNGVSFVNFANLTGSNSIADNFVFNGDDNITGLIDGGAGNGDSVNLVGLANGRDIFVSLRSGIDGYLSLNNIETVNANAANNNRLIAADRSNTWSISGVNNGAIEHTGNVLAETATAFTGFNTLIGGNQSDIFVFDGNDDITGLVDGGAGIDELRLSGLTRDVVVALDTQVTSDLNAVQFETITANSARNNTLRAGDDPNLIAPSNSWRIGAENAGSLNEVVEFSGFDNLIGSDANDIYEFILGGSLTGYIDGGNQDSQDVVDMRALQSASVTLGDGPTGMRNIERFIGNNTDSTITADNIRNTWNLISGSNDGTVNGIAFTDFNHLMGGSDQDTFNINGGSVTGTVNGSSGNDIVNLTLVDAVVGELDFIGGGDSDTLVIAGGSNSHGAVYSPDLAGVSRIEYTDAGGNIFSVNYASTETVRDNANAGQLTVNGSAAVDTIVLDANRVQVGDYTALNYTNKDNLVVAGSANDNVLINGTVTVPGQFTIRNSSVTAGNNALISAGGVLFNATGDVGGRDNRLTLDVASISVRATEGGVYLQNRGNVNLAELATANIFDLVAVGQVSSNAALSSQGPVVITAQNGNIDLTNSSNSLNGPLTLSAAGNEIALANSGVTDLASVASQTLTVTSAGSIRDSGPLTIAGLATFDSDADIVLDNQNNNFNSVAIVGATDATVVDANQLTLVSVDTTGTLSTRSQGVVVNGQVRSANVEIDAGNASATLNNTFNVGSTVDIQANGITAGGTVNASNILLTDSDGGINLTGILNANGGDILLNSQGANVELAGTINSVGGDVNVDAAGSISMSASARTVASDSVVSFIAGGNIGVTNINAGDYGTILLNSGGGITDQSSGSYDIVANRLEMSARAGIDGVGGNSVFETSINELFATNANGPLEITNSGTIIIDRLRSNGDIYVGNPQGDIIFNNEADNTYNRSETDALLAGGVSNANFSRGVVQINSFSGSIIAYGAADSTQPDLVGRVVNLIAPVGDVGSGVRPLVIYAQDRVFIQGFRSLQPFWAFGHRPELRDDSSVKLDLLDLINLGGEQLVEVEELEEVNPAIFTAVTNYFFDDVSIRLPNDQLYEDELEELTAVE